MPDHTLSRRRVLATVAAVATGGCLDAATSGPGATAADTDASPSETDATDSTDSADSADPTDSTDSTDSADQTDSAPTRSESATPTRADVGPDWPTPEATTTPGYGTEPTATAAVGDPDRRPSGMEPHGVVVRNATAGTATADGTTTQITTRVWRDGARVLARTDPLAAGEFLRVTLREPGRYLVAVRAAPDRRGVVVSNHDRTWFDCNASTTTVEARPDGYARGYITTMLACVTPE